MRERVFAKRIVDCNGLKNARNLMKRQDMQIGLSETITAEFAHGDFVILDFGKEIAGGINILSYWCDNAKVRVRFGESVSECCAQIGEKGATNDHALRDFTLELPSLSNMALGNTGFRFVRLDFIGSGKIKSVVANGYILKKAVKYRYDGADEVIRNIYKTAKRTVDLCAGQGYLWDGVKRDRLVWIGDIHPAMLALTTLYGRLPLIEKSLDFVKNQTPLPQFMNGYPMYSMWWIIIVADYHKRVNALDFVKNQGEYLTGLIDLMDDCVLPDGELNYPAYFVDWATHNKPDEKSGVRAINIMAVKKAIELLKILDKPTLKAEKLLSKLLLKPITAIFSKQVLGLKYFAVGLDESDKVKLIDGGAKGMSTFMSYYILKAVASFDKKKAVEIMKEYYGAMLDKGATTFWEDFDMEWAKNSCRIDEFAQNGQTDIHGDYGAYCYIGFRHSLCHGWSAGVIRFIEEEC